MKKKYLLLMALFTVVLFAASNFDVDAGATSFNISNTSYTLVKGKTLQLKVNGVKSKKIKWKSSKKSVATVSKTGLVKAVKSGTATISGKYKGITFKTKIVVEDKKQQVEVANNDMVTIYYCRTSDGKTYFIVQNKTKRVIQADVEYVSINGCEYAYGPYDASSANIAPNDKRTIYIETPDVSNVKQLSGVINLWEGDTGYLITRVPVIKK